MLNEIQSWYLRLKNFLEKYKIFGRKKTKWLLSCYSKVYVKPSNISVVQNRFSQNSLAIQKGINCYRHLQLADNITTQTTNERRNSKLHKILLDISYLSSRTVFLFLEKKTKIRESLERSIYLHFSHSDFHCFALLFLPTFSFFLTLLVSSPFL